MAQVSVVNNAINNTEKNTFNVIPAFNGSATGGTYAVNITPSFSQMTGSALAYYGVYDVPVFSFGGSTLATNVYGIYAAPAFNPTGTAILTNTFGIYTQPTATTALRGAVTNLYGLGVDLPTGASGSAVNLYTAYFGSFGSGTKVGIGQTTPGQALSITGGVSVTPTNLGLVTTYTALNTDFFIDVNTGTTTTVILPPPTLHSGQIFTIKDYTGTAAINPIEIYGTGGATIDGAPEISISAAYGVVRLFSNGVNYFLLDSLPGSSTAQVFTWTATTSEGPFTMASNTGYYTGTAAIFILPPTMTAGLTMEIAQTTAGTFTIVQASGQSLVFGNLSTTVGVTGSAGSTAQGDTLRILCTTANTTFQVLSSVGNFNIT